MDDFGVERFLEVRSKHDRLYARAEGEGSSESGDGPGGEAGSGEGGSNGVVR